MPLEIRRGCFGTEGEALQIRLIDITPPPVLAALGRLNQRMSGRMKMRPRMTARRRVAAAHMPALQAHAQMHPRVADFEALLVPLICEFLIDKNY